MGWEGAERAPTDRPSRAPTDRPSRHRPTVPRARASSAFAAAYAAHVRAAASAASAAAAATRRAATVPGGGAGSRAASRASASIAASPSRDSASRAASFIFAAAASAPLAPAAVVRSSAACARHASAATPMARHTVALGTGSSEASGRRPASSAARSCFRHSAAWSSAPAERHPANSAACVAARWRVHEPKSELNDVSTHTGVVTGIDRESNSGRRFGVRRDGSRRTTPFAPCRLVATAST